RRKEVLLAMELMARDLAEPLTLTSVAAEVGLSSFYLSRLFKEETGEAFNDYLTRLRIDQAIRLLKTTTLKVYEVAERVGIPSYRYFSVVFRGITGVSPTEFKKG
ncbi:AraC family transcriptional regulator, partial [Paenibacillus sepulcri]|nr:AraC family transcriptional regulator [Paenibacillus sepulcri]